MSVTDADAESVASSSYKSLLEMDVFKRAADEEGNFSSDSGHYSGDNTNYYSQQLYDDHIYETIEDFPGGYSNVRGLITSEKGKLLQNRVTTVTPPRLPPRNTKARASYSRDKSKSRHSECGTHSRKNCIHVRVSSIVGPSEVIDVGGNHVYTVEDVLTTLADYVAHLPDEGNNFEDYVPNCSDRSTTETIARLQESTNSGDNSQNEPEYSDQRSVKNFELLQSQCERMFSQNSSPSRRWHALKLKTSDLNFDLSTCNTLQQPSTSKLRDMESQGARVALGLLPEVFV
jgi:hypothetical protein